MTSMLIVCQGFVALVDPWGHEFWRTVSMLWRHMGQLEVTFAAAWYILGPRTYLLARAVSLPVPR